MNLLIEEYGTLKKIHKKIIEDTATFDEIQIFLNLIVKSGNDIEMLEYMKSIGFNKMHEIEEYLNKNNKDTKSKDIKTGLAIVGGAILLALLLS